MERTATYGIPQQSAIQDQLSNIDAVDGLKSDVDMGMSVPAAGINIDESFSAHTLTVDQKDELVEKLNQVLKGELSAIETYNQVLESITDERRYFVESFLNEHTDSANRLKRLISQVGGSIEESSGAWGVVAQSFTGLAKVFGDQMAIRALEEGEEIGLNDYENLREFDFVPRTIRSDIDSIFIPRQKRHIEKLGDLSH